MEIIFSSLYSLITYKKHLKINKFLEYQCSGTKKNPDNYHYCHKKEVFKNKRKVFQIKMRKIKENSQKKNVGEIILKYILVDSHLKKVTLGPGHILISNPIYLTNIQ